MSLPVKFFWSIFLQSFRIIMLENIFLVFWETFLTFLTIFFFTWFSKLAKSFVPAWTIRQSGLLFANWSMFSRIVVLVPPGGIVYLYSIILAQTFLVYSIQHRISCNNHPFFVLSLSILFYLYPYLFCLRIHCHKAIYYH